MGADGTVHVVDYKTGSASAYKNPDGDNPVVGGTKLQLPIYGLAGRLAAGDQSAPVRAEYWFATTRGRFERAGYDITDRSEEHKSELQPLMRISYDVLCLKKK